MTLILVLLLIGIYFIYRIAFKRGKIQGQTEILEENIIRATHRKDRCNIVFVEPYYTHYTDRQQRLLNVPLQSVAIPEVLDE